jgi:hypothetical protein
MFGKGVVGRGWIEERGLPPTKKNNNKVTTTYFPATDYHKHYVMAPSESSKQSKSEDQTFWTKVFFLIEKEKRVKHHPQICITWLEKDTIKKANLYFLEKVMRSASKPIASKEKTSEVTRLTISWPLPLFSFRKHLKTLLYVTMP